MIYPKLMLQSTWENKIGWDDAVPLETKKDFERWAKELCYLQEIEIPRNMRGENYFNASEQLHIFCDASNLAYTAIAFLRVESTDNVSVQLVQAKARVSPIQKMTTPRLELMACVIGTRLGNSVKKVFERSIECFYWSDDEWGTFVGNRVREIVNQNAATNWRHVPGKLNPADLPSRGCSPKELLQSIWWEGPKWLKRPANEWPNEEFQIDEEAVNAEKKKSVQLSNNLKIISVVEEPLYSKTSSHILNLLKIARLKRFTYNCMAKKRNVERRVGYLTRIEINEAEVSLVKMIKMASFSSRYELLSGATSFKRQ